MVSLENIILLFLIIFLSPGLINYNKSNRKYQNLIMLLFFFGSVFIMSIITINFGISARQKWMFLPIFLYQLVYFRSLTKN